MKHLLTPVFLTICAFYVNQTAYASEENIVPTITDQGQAADLVTQPISINTKAGDNTSRTNNLRQVAGSISVARDRGCNTNPLEFIKNPASNLKQCLKKSQNQAPKPTEPVNYYKIPPLESGIRVNVSQF